MRMLDIAVSSRPCEHGVCTHTAQHPHATKHTYVGVPPLHCARVRVRVWVWVSPEDSGVGWDSPQTLNNRGTTASSEKMTFLAGCRPG